MLPRHLVRNALLEILRSTPEPASIHDLATAVYFRTGDDRVGYSSVANALRMLARERQVVRVDGLWAVAS